MSMLYKRSLYFFYLQLISLASVEMVGSRYKFAIP